ncbi:hypothetical protein AALO_G00101170, partial [Alosa alosa]
MRNTYCVHFFSIDIAVSVVSYYFKFGNAESGVEPRFGSYSQKDFGENLSQQLAGISVKISASPSAAPTTTLLSFHQVHIPVQQEPK